MSNDVVDEMVKLSTWMSSQFNVEDNTATHQERCIVVVEALRAYFNGDCLHSTRTDGKCDLCEDELEL